MTRVAHTPWPLQLATFKLPIYREQAMTQIEDSQENECISKSCSSDVQWMRFLNSIGSPGSQHQNGSRNSSGILRGVSQCGTEWGIQNATAKFCSNRQVSLQGTDRTSHCGAIARVDAPLQRIHDWRKHPRHGGLHRFIGKLGSGLINRNCVNGRLDKEQTLAENAAMTELRTLLPFTSPSNSIVRKTEIRCEPPR